jgi:molybdopterin-containing oxidoreductase family membrane subunit
MKGENHLSRLDESKLYDELSRSNLPATKRWYAGTGALLLVVLAAVATFVYMMFVGLGVTGLNRPVMWGVMIILFVFWVGLSHSGRSSPRSCGSRGPPGGHLSCGGQRR